MSENVIRQADPQAVPADVSVELAARRTGMSFQRTRMSADRTLMSVIRTSLSLISFGFTIYQLFEKAFEAGILESSLAARNFGLALVLLGTVMLLLGIVYHLSFMAGLRRERAQMKADGLVHGESAFPVSLPRSPGLYGLPPCSIMWKISPC